jgi:hypothetical protein
MTNKTQNLSWKEERVIKYLTQGHLKDYGGYPYDYIIHSGLLHVATLDDSKDRKRTLIETYNYLSLSILYDEACDYIATHNEECDEGYKLSDYWDEDSTYVSSDWCEAFSEVFPRPIELE